MKILYFFGSILLFIAIIYGFFETNQEKFFSLLIFISTKVHQYKYGPFQHFGKVKKIQSTPKIKIWTEFLETSHKTPKGTITLVNGGCLQSNGYPPEFYSKFLNVGYNVIRFDNRGSGFSSWGDYETEPWTAVEMAKDITYVLDSWNIKKTHIFGLSTGGIIVQQFIIDYPERVLSAIIASTWGNKVEEELYIAKR
jgi:pimeloyl-ACP methyl ester carboxylesterase